MIEKPNCNQCQKLLEMYDKEPDCLKCLPATMPENEAAFRIYDIVNDQVIGLGMGGEIVALMNEPIWSAIDRFRGQFLIYDDLECFFQVKKIASIVFEKRREKGS